MLLCNPFPCLSTLCLDTLAIALIVFQVRKFQRCQVCNPLVVFVAVDQREFVFDRNLRDKAIDGASNCDTFLTASEIEFGSFFVRPNFVNWLKNALGRKILRQLFEVSGRRGTLNAQSSKRFFSGGGGHS